MSEMEEKSLKEQIREIALNIAQNLVRKAERYALLNDTYTLVTEKSREYTGDDYHKSSFGVQRISSSNDYEQKQDMKEMKELRQYIYDTIYNMDSQICGLVFKEIDRMAQEATSKVKENNSLLRTNLKFTLEAFIEINSIKHFIEAEERARRELNEYKSQQEEKEI